jgi:KDO2-lipid IV(A) lauroyltransferase
MVHKIAHIFEYTVFLFLSFMVRLLPLRMVHKIGYVLGRIGYLLLKSRRMVALRNLQNAFPGMNVQQLEQIARRSFQHITATFVELLWSPNYTKELIKERVLIDNLDVLTELLKKKKGVVFVTAHFGSWEISAQAIVVNTLSTVCAIAKSQTNLFIDRRINRWREMFGVKVIPMGISVRDVVRTLHAGGIVTLVADQTAPKESVAVEFFGRQVPTFEGPAVFCLKTGAPIVVGCAVRQEDGSYEMHLVHVPSDDIVGSSQEQIRELTQRQVRLTEEAIRQHPEQWMWMHKRWKHVPDRVEIS